MIAEQPQKRLYQQELGRLAKGLLYDFMSVFEEGYSGPLEEALALETKAASIFIELRENLENTKTDIENELPYGWKDSLGKEPGEIAAIAFKGLESAGLAGIYLEKLVDAYVYYRYVVSRFMAPEATIQTITENKSPIKDLFELNSEQVFDHYESHPDLLRVYGKGFVGSHLLADLELVSNYDFKQNTSILDIGGGYGHLGNLIKQKHSVDYTLFDLPSALSLFSPELSSSENHGSGFRSIGGDFFVDSDDFGELEGQQFDQIILGWILHDWDDSKCEKIMKKCANHLKPNGEILVLETLKEPGNEKTSFLHWVIFVMANGFERTLPEYRALFDQADLELNELIKYESHRSVLCLKKKDP